MPVLTDDKIKQAYHDRMPNPWIERLAATGCTVPTETLQRLQVYFGQQETLARPIEEAITHDKADLPCGEEEEMMQLMNNKNNGLAVGAAVAIVVMIDVLLTKDNKDSNKLRLPRPSVKMLPVEPPASALQTTLRAPCTLVPDTHGASAMKMHTTVPTTTIKPMLKEQAADNAVANNSHNKEAKHKTISWRQS